MKKNTKKELVHFFQEMDGLVKDFLKENDDFDDLDVFSTLRLKLLILMIEIQKDENISKELKKICRSFHS